MRAKFVFGNILNELSENSTLYHRSLKKMEVGDVIKPKLDKTGDHWLSKTPFEKALEIFRKKNYPDRPSRFNSVYSSVIPRSRFKDKGYLYVVKPVGKIFMTDSRLIDEMDEKFGRKYYEFTERYSDSEKERANNPEILLHILDYFGANQYWKGTSRGDKESLEVLSDGAIITEVVGVKEDHLMHNDIVEIIEENKIKIESTIYFNKEQIEKYKSGDKQINDLIKIIKSLYKSPEENFRDYGESYGGGGNLSIDGFIKKGTKLQIKFARSSMSEKKSKGYDDYKARQNYKYIKIVFNIPGYDDKSIEHKIEYFYSYNKDIRDITKYLKIL